MYFAHTAFMHGRFVRCSWASAGLALLTAACASEYHPEYHPVSSYTVNQSVSYPTIYEVASAPTPPPLPEPVDPREPARSVDPSRVLVVEATHLDRPNEVIGVVDVANDADTREAGVALLKRRAAELGADAVVGVEFHHGDGAGHPPRASGLAVRFEGR